MRNNAYFCSALFDIRKQKRIITEHQKNENIVFDNFGIFDVFGIKILMGVIPKKDEKTKRAKMD